MAGCRRTAVSGGNAVVKSVPGMSTTVGPVSGGYSCYYLPLYCCLDKSVCVNDNSRWQRNSGGYSGPLQTPRQPSRLIGLQLCKFSYL